MARGKRYDTEQKLNLKKVFAVIIAIAVIIMFSITIGKILNANLNNTGKNIPLHYYSVYTNGKWGIINSKAEQIIEPQYSEMIIVPNKEKGIFICTYDVDYTAGTYKTKAINTNGDILFGNYESVEALSNYNSTDLWYEQNLLKVKKDEKYGLIDLEGKIVIDCLYEDIYTLKGVINSIVTKKDGKLGLVDTLGNIIINNEYKNVKPLTENYSDGYIVINNSNKYGVISFGKQLLIECKYDDIKNCVSNGNYIVKNNSTWKITNSDGQIYLDGKYSDIKLIKGDYAIVKNNKSYGIVTLTGEEKVAASYQDINFAFTNYFIAKKDNSYGIIDLANNPTVEFKYTTMEYNSDANCIIATNKDNNIIDIINNELVVKEIGRASCRERV